MTVWTDLSAVFAYGTKLTSTQMQQLRDNITAAFEKAGGAPVLANDYVVNAMIGASAVGNTEMDDNAIGQAEMGSAAIGQAELKTSTQTQSLSITSQSNGKFTLTGGQYCFKETAKGETADIQWAGSSDLTTSYATVVSLYNSNSTFSKTGYVIHRYVTASGEVYWIFILRDKTTKEIIRVSACDDHPCFGCGGKPQLTPHPFGDAYDAAIHEIIVINPTKKEVVEMQNKTIIDSETEPDKCLAQVIAEDFEIDETTEPAWPAEAVTVGLPPEWEKKKIGDKIDPILKKIPRPAGYKTAKLKLKPL